MRLIDADALPMYDELFMKGINKSGVWVRYRDVEKLIRNAPTIEERKKGKWIDLGDYCICNQCWHTEQQFDGVECIPKHTRFCSNCGAEMNEKE